MTWRDWLRREQLTLLVLAALLLLAFGVRTLPFLDGIFVDGKVVFCDTDPYYHMRRAEHLLTYNFQLIEFDYYLNYPQGGVSFWPPGFDMLLAGFIKLFAGGATDRATIEPIAAWLPPLLGSLIVLPVWAMARRLFGTAAGLLAAAIVAFMPGHIVYSQLGKVDQHVAEALTGMLLYAWFFRLLGTMQPERRRWLLPVAGGIFVWLAYIMWSGATLYLVPLFAAMGLLLLLSPDGYYRVYLREATLFLLAALTLMLYPCLTSWWGRQWLFAHDALSLLQLVFLGGVGLYFGGAWLLVGWQAQAGQGDAGSWQSRLKILAGYSLVFLLLVGGLVALAPDTARALQEGMRLLLKKGDASYHIWLTTISEYTPLWRTENGSVVWAAIVGNLTRWFWLVPPMLLLLMVRVWRGPAADRLPAATVLVLTVFLGLLNMQQSRYSYVFGGMVAVCAAGLLAWFWRWLQAHPDLVRIQWPPRAQRAGAYVKSCLPFVRGLRPAPALLLVLLTAGWLAHECRLVTESMFFAGGRPLLSPADYQMLEWLRNNTPAPGSFSRPQEKPVYDI
ncbi:MAG TPA: STT3 domain-containing protein, partial [bacterium]|nr:STT3 domain-containing protein [bacterium]